MPQNNRPKSPHPRFISDVVRPSRVRPSDSSRPIIVSNRPQQRDGMVVDHHSVELDYAQGVQGPPPLSGRQSVHEVRSQHPQHVQNHPTELVAQNEETPPNYELAASDYNQEQVYDHAMDYHQDNIQDYYPRPKRKWLKRTIITIIILILLFFVVLDLGLDAKIIHYHNLHSVTHFFKHKINL